MSLATRCPACGTTFRVVRDQLRISDGWVRCGRCSHVFDGAAELHDPLSGPLPVTPPAVPVTDTPAAPSAGIDFFSDALSRLQADGPPPAQRAPVEPSAWPALDIPSSAWPASPVREDPTLDEVAELEEEPVPTPALALPVPPDDGWARLPSLQLDAVPMTPAVAAPPPDLPEVEAEIEDAGPSALRQSRLAALQAARARRAAEAERPSALQDEAITLALTPSEPLAGDATGVPVFGIARSFRANPGAQPMQPPSRWAPRLMSGFVLLALVLLLLAQVLYQQRNAIVARQPALQPWFATACERLGCQLSALRRIADVTIDGASFLREKDGEGYQFSFTLRNRAAIPLAMPAVELSLLDLEERVVVRRVLRPAEYGAPAVLAAHAERMTQLPIVLVGEDASSASRVAGFRLDAFYP
ncbi:zinc-ribbon and DUF3426 domain-containing protein [Variovorax sp. UMC13]|uniref:zinc-ribbon and DUF3426 domain-containing protein n=1 Tax=Variovorax sp. UMC13 TaxID=1862326 RepID=UPI00160405D5|nr:zinc-ribbon and DUF3426 domain-containing protein [Variovorax sp. UMC13]MBB1603891.1 hypothetical protein [Variovorax sp. UMC13]